MKLQVELEEQMPLIPVALRVISNAESDQHITVQLCELSESQLEEYLKKLNDLYREKWKSQKLQKIETNNE